MRTTFVIPCFNAERTLQRAILSALASVNVNVEVIVVDDASSDGSVDIVRGINDPRLILLPQLKNSGPSVCRNIGIDAADGDWIAILDADDWVVSERTEKLLKLAAEHSLDLVADNQWVINQFGKVLKKRFSDGQYLANSDYGSFALIELNELLEQTGLGICQPIIRRDLLRRSGIRYRNQFKYGEDYHLLFDLVNAGARFGYVDEAMYYAELVQGSLTSNRVKMFSGMIDVLKSVRSELESTGKQEFIWYVDEAIRRCQLTVAYGAVMDPLKEGRYMAALSAFCSNPRFWRQLPSRLQAAFKRD